MMDNNSVWKKNWCKYFDVVEILMDLIVKMLMELVQ